MGKKLTQRLNFSFITEHDGKRFGVIPKGSEGTLDWSKSNVYEIVNEATNQYIEIIGPKKYQIMEEYLKVRSSRK